MKWDYNYVSVMFYIEICLRLGNGLEGLSKVPPKNLQILISDIYAILSQRFH